MKKLSFALLLVCLVSEVYGQEPFLRIDYRQTFLGDRIDILDGPKVLNKEEVYRLMQTQPEAFETYQMALKKQKTGKLLDGGAFLTSMGVIALSFIPPQSASYSTRNNLLLPLAIATVGIGIASGFYRRSSRNLTREAVDLYNFSEKKPDPIYFDDGLTYYTIPDFVGFQIRF
ncbi:hypothetical protein [Aquiflexum gelatinilyticum]|uniref:Uncharacterized protein n=1 Tax=Aquiflexum gelatinilyticum TaxID=2961943 RepID=A0A9X2P293_9BACT|nr:hypothetical protein [Aquiflexum gelatinilyticum]MCR9014171.1 hypothetical protein [Aquiflexum gelatinilyticum]